MDKQQLLTGTADTECHPMHKILCKQKLSEMSYISKFISSHYFRK